LIFPKDLPNLIDAAAPEPGSRGPYKKRIATWGQKNVDKLTLWGFLIVATALEATGDAIVRMGINQNAWLPRSLLFVAGAVLLFGYGFSVNLAPVEFGRVVGLYIAMLFVVWQLVNWVVFRAPPIAPVLVGGLLIVAGGAIVTFWK
jgi:hypothetical protein